MRLRQLRSSDNGRRLERNAWYHNRRPGPEGIEWTNIMLKKTAAGICALVLLSTIAIGVAYTQSPPNPQNPLAAPLTVERSSDRLSANARWTPNQGAEYQAFAVVAKLLAGEPDTTGHGVKADTLRYIDWPLAGDVGRLTITQLDPGRDYVYGMASAAQDSAGNWVWSQWEMVWNASPTPSDTTVATSTPTHTPTPVGAQTPTTGELPSDNPPVNFRVASYNDTLVWVQWEIPHNRGIASYILQKYDHDGNGFVADPYRRWEGEASGGYGFGKSYGDLTPDTRYKFTLTLKNAQGAALIQKSVELRTLPPDSDPGLSSDAKLSDLTLSGVDLGGFASYKTLYRANVPSDVAQITVTPTLRHSGASYVIKLNGVVDADGVIPLTLVNNVIAIEVTAEDGIVSETYTVFITSVARSTPTSTTTNPTATPTTVATSTPTHTPTPAATPTPTSAPKSTPTPTTGELPSDNPPLNFRVAGYTDTWVWVQWEVPHNRGIASFVLQKYDHDGNGFVADPYGRWEGAASGGYGFGKSYGDLTPDSRYKFTLTLKNAQGAAVIQKSLELRTLVTNNTPTPTPVAIDTPTPTRTSVAPPTPVKETPTPTPAPDTPTPTPTPVATVTPTPTSGDNPPVNFRATRYTNTLWVQWAVPRNRGIASFVLQKYDHDGSGFVEDPYGRWEGAASGGNGFGKSYGDLTPDTLYKFTLTLKNAQGAAVIQKSLEVRTLQ